MNFLLDENFPKAAQKVLEERGHTVIELRGTPYEGSEDTRIFDLAQHHQAVILTTDRDFYHTVPWLYTNHFGVVVIALRQPNREAILSRLGWLLTQEQLFPLKDKVLQLRDSTFRMRQAD